MEIQERQISNTAADFVAGTAKLRVFMTKAMASLGEAARCKCNERPTICSAVTEIAESRELPAGHPETID